MLHSLIMLVTKKTLYTILILKVYVPQDIVSLHNFIKDVEIERELIDALNLLYKLSTDWAANSKVVVKYREAFSAESVSTVYENSWNLLSNIELFTAIVAKIKSPSLIVSLKQILGPPLILFIIEHLLVSFSLRSKSIVLLATIFESFTFKAI
jgi:hypothetical protein